MTKIDSMINGVEEIKEVVSAERLSTELIRSEEGLAGLEAVWEELHAEAGTPVFMSYEWITNWWEHFGKNRNRSLHILLLKNDEGVVAIAPMYEGVSRFLGRTLVKRLSLMGCGTDKNETLGFTNTYGRSDFLDFLVKPGMEEAVTNRIIQEFARDEYGVFSYFKATHISDRSYIVNYLIPALNKIGMSMTISETDTCPYIKMTDSYEETYLYEVSSNTRRRLRQSVKAIGKDNGYEVHDIEDEEILMREYERMRDMHQERWNKIGYPGSFFDRRFDSFMKDYIIDAFRKGRISFRYATDSGGHCASRMALVDNGRYFDYMGSFDYEAASSKYRPGIGLLVLMIMDAHEQGMDSVELLRGDESYKYDFTSEEFKNREVKVLLGSESKSGLKMMSDLFDRLSSVYMLISKEFTLMRVHKLNAGIAGMIPAYIKSRVQRLKEQLQSD